MGGCTRRHLWDAYRFLGCRPTPTAQGIFNDKMAGVTHLCRLEKRRHAVYEQFVRSWYDRKTWWVRDLPCGDTRVYLVVRFVGSSGRRAAR